MELISVIVPVYNVEKYLDYCVGSIINQTYKNLEIILVDDGSSDNCPVMCDIWAKKDVRIKVVHKKNGGLSEARNVGLSIATGNFIAFVDSDDWIDLRYIEYLYNAIRHTKAEIVACNMRKVYKEPENMSTEEDMPEEEIATPEEAICDILNNCRFRAVVWNKLYQHEIIKDEKFEIGCFHEDEFFSYRIIDKAQKLAYIDIPLYNYRQREGSIMSSFSLHHLDVLDAYIGRIELLEQKYPDLVARDKLNFCITCVNFYIDIYNSEKAIKKKSKLRIQACRKKIQFSREELLSYSWREKIYILISGKGFTKLAYLLKIFRRVKNDG